MVSPLQQIIPRNALQCYFLWGGWRFMGIRCLRENMVHHRCYHGNPYRGWKVVGGIFF